MRNTVSTKELLKQLGCSEEVASEVYLHLKQQKLNKNDKLIMKKLDEYLFKETHENWRKVGFKGGEF